MRRTSILLKSMMVTVLCITVIGAVAFAVYSGLINLGTDNEETVFAEAPVDDTDNEAIIETTPTPTPTPEPTPAPTPSPWELFNPTCTEETDPETARNFRYDSAIVGALGPIHFGLPHTYTHLNGVTTFRGNNFRNTASFGTVNITDRLLSERFRFGIGGMSGSQGNWSGTGWTGQPAIVKWDFDVQQLMNINAEHRDNPDLVEVIQGAMDGYVYFFDLNTGSFTRPPLRVGYTIKGAVTIDPRGYPLLYVGQGDSNGGRFGYYIYSLIDGSELFHLNGNESVAPRRWGAFDSNPLFDTENDRMVLCGENGVVYNFLLNTDFNRGEGTISIEPEISRFWYTTGGRRLGIENSPVAFGHYLFFANNSGTILCLNLLTFEPVWVFESGDDHDATLTAQWDEEAETLFLYSATQVDIQGNGGYAYIRKIDASNGSVVWENAYRCIYHDTNGGVTASPLLGQGDISNLVIFSVAKLTGRGSGGVLVAFDTQSGEVVWEHTMQNYGWSSPVGVYTDDGTGYVIFGDSVGNLFLMRGTTGEILHQINLGGNIEASPAVYGNILVVGTRGQRIYGIDIH